MANCMVIGGKVVYKSGGGGGWRTGMGPRPRRWSRSDDASDEEYVVGGDEEEVESSYDSYSSDASQEAEDAEEERDEEAYDSGDDDAMEAGRERRPRKGSAGSWGKRRTLPPLRRNSSTPFVADEGEEVGTPPVRSSRTRGSAVLAEEDGGEYEDDDDDEDFAPEEEDDDEEEVARPPVRKTGSVKSKPLKRLRRKRRPMNSDVKGKRKTAPLTRKKRQRIHRNSDNDDFVDKDKISVVATRRKKKEKEKKKEINVSNGIRKRRRSCVLRSDQSESDSSDFDYTISVDVPRRLDRLVRKPPSSVNLGEKGKGKGVDGLGKQVCGICLSEERKGVIRGLLNCCSHYFCFACIMEWSKVESRCPLCKRRFETVSKSARSDAGFSLRTAVIRIPKRDQVYQPSEEEIRGYLDPYANVVCVECQQGGDDNLMLLCDLCDSPTHTYCVGLGREVPDGNWYCDVCRLMDPGSSNSEVQQSVVEHGVRNDLFQDNFCGVVDSAIASLCSPPETPRQTATPRLFPSEGIGQGASNRYPPSLGYHETLLEIAGFTASTVSGRRSIHQRMRNMLSDNSISWRSEVVARNNVIQPSSMPNEAFSEQQQETLGVRQQNLTNEIHERSSRSFLSSRVNFTPHTHNEGSRCHMAEAANLFS